MQDRRYAKVRASSGALLWVIFEWVPSRGRLTSAAPNVASATISLNMSNLYLGQATGVAVGGLSFGSSDPRLVTWIALAFLLAAIAMTAWGARAADEHGRRNT